MVTLCVKINRIIIRIILVIVIVAVTLLIMFMIKFKFGNRKMQPEAYLQNLGYKFTQVDEKQIYIPKKFGENMKKYNDLQQQQGFNLEKYSGQKCTQKKYYLKNFSNINNENYVVNLIVCDGVVIGGDLQKETFGDEAKAINALSNNKL